MLILILRLSHHLRESCEIAQKDGVKLLIITTTWKHATQVVAVWLLQVPPELSCILELPLPLTATDAVATPPCFALPACALACFTRADAPSWGRALVSAGCVIYAGNHRDGPCTKGLSRLNQKLACFAAAKSSLGKFVIMKNIS